MAYIIARTTSQGRRAGVVSACAIFVGILVHILLAAGGLSAILLASQTAFNFVRYAGAAYLLYLAYRMICSRQTNEKSVTAHNTMELSRIFWEGVLVNLFNPKIALFMLSFLPQFVDPGRGQIFMQILILGMIFNAGGLVWSISVVYAVQKLKRGFSASEKWQIFSRWFVATILGGLAVKLIISERS